MSHNGEMESVDGRIKILLVDDHPVVREGIRSCLSGYSELEIVGEASDGQEAIDKALALNPHIVLMDINMPRMKGMDATARLRSEAPHIKVLALSAHHNREYVERMITASASGFVLKDVSPQELLEAIKAVFQGETFFSASVSKFVLSELVTQDGKVPYTDKFPLSPREVEVLRFIAEGMTNKEIAGRLALSVRTVETHRERIMEKLNIRSIAGLTKFAVSSGLVNL